MIDKFPFLPAFAAGLTINAFDIGCTLLFAAKPWEDELRRQGIEPRSWTPPYYIFVNFVGGFILAFVYLQFANTLGFSVRTAIVSSLVIWSTTRIYGGGHVVMGQMPVRIFLIMSIGLGLGYVAGGQVIRLLVSS